MEDNDTAIAKSTIVYDNPPRVRVSKTIKCGDSYFKAEMEDNTVDGFEKDLERMFNQIDEALKNQIAKARIDEAFAEKPAPPQQNNFNNPPAQAPAGDAGTCFKCGAPNKLSKNKMDDFGNPKKYCSDMCWKRGQ